MVASWHRDTALKLIVLEFYSEKTPFLLLSLQSYYISLTIYSITQIMQSIHYNSDLFHRDSELGQMLTTCGKLSN